MPDWINTSIFILTQIIILVGLFGLIVPIFPGTVVIWLATLGYGVISGFGRLGMVLFVIITILMLAGTLADNVFLGAGARKGGASWKTIGVALVAGVHGMEYTPILALQRLRDTIDPAHLRGAVILVHVANMPSFLGRTVYYSPIDGKNLNRVFPGRADGTVSDRIAEALTREVIAPATHLIDIHCGDGNESLRPYSYWMTTAAPDVNEASRRLVHHVDHVR